MEKLAIGILVGSLRKASFNMKMAKVIQGLGGETLSLDIIRISDLPLYNEDLEASLPAQWNVFRNKLRSFDGFVFITPEYNRSIPAVLKNAIDVGSRPYGQSGWDGKPGAVISVSPGQLGAFGANHHLRQSLVFLNVPAMPQPEAYIGNAATLFDENGHLVNESTGKFLAKFMEAFAKWVYANKQG